MAATKLVIALDYSLSGNHKAVKEAQYYVEKALAIDGNSAKANAVKARLLLGNDWSDSETYFKKAIALNPNDAETHYWYADYFLKIDDADIKQALEHITIANQLSPFSSVIASKYTWLLILNGRFEEADKHIKDYGFLMSHDERSWLSVTSMGFKNKDWQPAFDWAENQIIKEPEHAANYNIYLAQGYDMVFIDRLKSKAYARKAFELNTDRFSYYFRNMTRNGHLKEAKQIMQTDFFKNLSESARAYYTWHFYYYKKEYKQAQNVIDNKPESWFGYNKRSRTYAQLGDREKLDSINKIYFVHGEFKYFNKAYVHAILKERDSMYYYLNKVRYSYRNAFCIKRKARI